MFIIHGHLKCLEVSCWESSFVGFKACMHDGWTESQWNGGSGEQQVLYLWKGKNLVWVKQRRCEGAQGGLFE